MKFIKCDGGLYNIDAISNICCEGNSIFLYPIEVSGKPHPATIECKDETIAAVVMDTIELFLADSDAVVFDAIRFAEGAAEITSQMCENESDEGCDECGICADEDEEDDYFPISVRLVLADDDKLPSAIWRNRFLQ